MIYTDPKMRTWAEIDLKALRHNFDIARSTGKKVMCVIKADGYGHGAVELGKHLEQYGAYAFAVACLDEALTLRDAGIKLPILILGYTPAEYAGILAENRITATIVDENAALQMEQEAARQGVSVQVHIKIDTGMSRLGFLAQTPEQIIKSADAITRCAAYPHLKIEGMFTHFAVADTLAEDAYTSFQLANYNAMKKALAQRGISIPLCHAANSAAIMEHSDAHFDMVREGIILYGLYPDSVPREKGPLHPVMTLKTRVAQVKEYPEDVTISYGRTFCTKQPTKIAVLTVGYADGFPRRQSNQAIVTINGKEYRQIGRICMDMCMVDVTGSDVKRGDEVILFGTGGCSLEQVSENVGTINYELCCLVTPRVPRVYQNAEK